MDLKLRQTYLGGTDLTAISGLSPWRRPGDVWMEKTGRSLGFQGNAATEAGQDFEDVVAMRHARRRRAAGEIVELGSLQDPIFHPDFPFIAANPDRIYLNRRRVLECKTASEDQLRDPDYNWGENEAPGEVPPWFLGQTNHYVGLLKYEDAYLSAFFFGRKREQRDYPIPFDRELYDLLIGNGVNFWRSYVEPDVQPPVELFSPDVVMKAIALRAKDAGIALPLSPTPELEEWARQYRELGLAEKAAKGSKHSIGVLIADWIATNGGTKVVHSLGSFTFQRPKQKPAETVFLASDAWTDLCLALERMNLPSETIDQLMNMASTIRKKYTVKEQPEQGEAKLRPWWKKSEDEDGSE